MTKERKTNNRKTFITTIAVIIALAVVAVLVYIIPGNNDAGDVAVSNKTTETQAKDKSDIESDDAVENGTDEKSDINHDEDNSDKAKNDFEAHKDENIDEETKKAIEEIEEQFPDEINAVEVEAAPDVDYKRGKVTDTTYESEFLGLRFNVPEGWQNVSEEELLKMDMTEGTACELQCYNTNDESNIMIVFEKLPADTITPEIYINSMVSSIQNSSGFEVSDLKNDETIDIASQKYNVLSFAIMQNDTTYYQKYFVRQINDYMAVISASARSEEAIDNNILNNFIKY